MTPPTSTTKLHELLLQSGARLDPDDLTPDDFGAPQAEYAALREMAGLALRTDRALLALHGEDRARFLHGLVTCDVQALGPGEGTYGYFTSPQGRILADAVVLQSADDLTVSVPADPAPELLAHLQRYIIMDRVEVQANGARALTLAGPDAIERLRIAGLELPADPGPWRHGRGDLAGSDVHWVVEGRLGTPGITVWAAAEQAPAVWERLAALAGVRAVGRTALETVRVEEGIPRFGSDFGPDNLPQETGEESAISYTKGCYLGQEVVARIHYRGKVNRRLRGLRFDGAEPPSPGAAIQSDGREIGRLGSSVLSPRLGGPIGLAILHLRGGEPGTWVDIEGGVRARVVELPFAREPDD